MLETAIHLAQIGLKVIPARGKAGIKDTYRRATTHERQIIEWWNGKYWGYNLAVVLDDSLMVVDLDARSNGPGHWAEITAGKSIPATLSVSTPTGGEHHYFRLDGSQKIRGRENLLAPGVDIWSGKRIMIAPPSIHPTTLTEYRFRNGEAEWARGNSLIADAPTWLVQKVAGVEQLPAAQRSGGRHHALLIFALDARVNNGLDLDDLYTVLRIYSEQRGFDKPHDEMWRIARDTVAKYDFDPEQRNPGLNKRLADSDVLRESFKKSWSRA